MNKSLFLQSIKTNLKNIQKSLELLKHETVNISNSMALAKPLETEIIIIKKHIELNLAKTKLLEKQKIEDTNKIKEIQTAIKVIKARLEKTKQKIEKQYLY